MRSFRQSTWGKFLTLFVLVSFMFSFGGCSSSSSDSGGSTAASTGAGAATVSTDEKVNINNYNTATKGLADSMQSSMTGIHDAISKASSGYTKTISASTVTQSEADAFTDALAATADDVALSFLYNYDAAILGKSVESDTTKGAAKSIFIVKDANDVGATEAEIAVEQNERRPLVFVVAGIALLGYGAYKGVATAIDKRSQPAKNALTKTNEGSEEHKEFNKALGLDPSASKSETQAAFDNLGLNSKLTKAKEIEAINRDPDVGSLSVQSEIGQSVAEASVELGKTAVTTTVGAATTATGGQGLDKIAQATGLSQTTAAAVDLAVSAAGSQPLDILGNHLTVNVNSASKKDVDIEKPSKAMEIDAAKDLLKKVADNGLDAVKDAQELIDAANTMAQAIAKDNAEALGTTVNGDGSMTVKLPDQSHIDTVDNPQNNGIIKIPDMGMSDVLVAITGIVPELIENINTTDNPSIGIENVDVDEYDEEVIQEPSEGNYNLVVVASPSDPAAGQTVSVTATINPVKSGVNISFSITGTDGYSNSSTNPTNSSGKSYFSIPGGQDGVHDTVTVSVEGGVTKTFSYTF